MAPRLPILTLTLAAASLVAGCGSSTKGHHRDDQQYGLVAGCGAGGASLTGPHLLPGEVTSLNATGKAYVYAARPTQGALRTEALNDLEDDGTLSSARVVTETLGFDRATRSDYVFKFQPKSESYRETAAYTYAGKMLDYLATLVPELDDDCAPLVVQVLGKSYGTVKERANAAYTPADRSTDGRPRVTVGSGDGTELADLAVDFDVIAHEVAHHMIVRNLSVLRGDALPLHEGLADFFVFAATGDACLAESVCKAHGDSCAGAGACLRSGDNKRKWDSTDVTTDAHLRGMTFSGLLWDLAKNDGLGLEAVAKLTTAALARLSGETTAGEFGTALLAADEDLSDARNAAAINARLCARGLTTDGCNEP